VYCSTTLLTIRFIQIMWQNFPKYFVRNSHPSLMYSRSVFISHGHHNPFIWPVGLWQLLTGHHLDVLALPYGGIRVECDRLPHLQSRNYYHNMGSQKKFSNLVKFQVRNCVTLATNLVWAVTQQFFSNKRALWLGHCLHTGKDVLLFGKMSLSYPGLSIFSFCAVHENVSIAGVGGIRDCAWFNAR